MKCTSLAATFAVALLGTPLLAQAVIPMSYSEMVKTSEIIAVGTVTQSVSRFEENGKTIRTYATVRQLSVQKGKVENDTLVLRLEGGKVGQEVLQVSGMPKLKVGSRYLMYLAPNDKHLSPFVGYCQGVFEITAVSGREVLKNSNGLELIGIENDRFVFALPPAPPRAEAPEAVAVPDFKPVPAKPNADELEAEALRKLKEQARTEPGVRQAPPSDVPPVDPREDVASPPPAPAAAPKRELPMPIYVPATKDRGQRASVSSLLTSARAVR